MYRLREAALHHVNVRLKKGLQLHCVITPHFETVTDGNRVAYPTDKTNSIGVIPVSYWEVVSHHFKKDGQPIVLAEVPKYYQELHLDEISGFEIIR